MDSFKKAALKLNQAVFVWYLSNFSANKRKEKECKLLCFFTPSKVSYKKAAEKKNEQKVAQTQEVVEYRIATQVSTPKTADDGANRTLNLWYQNLTSYSNCSLHTDFFCRISG